MPIIRIPTADSPGRFWVAILSICCTVVSAHAVAGQWYFEPVVSMQLGYNDNTQLSTSSKLETLTSNTVGTAAFGFRTEVSDVSITAKMVDARFDDHKDLNTNDQFLTFKSSLQTSSRNQFGLDANYSRVSTRTSEFDYSGYSSSEGVNITKSINVFWDGSLTERTSLKIGGGYTKSDYEEAEGSGLSGNRNKSVNVTLRHKLSERMSLQAVVNKSLQTSVTTEFDTTSVQAGFDYMFSETFSVNLLLGKIYTESEVDGAESTSGVGNLINAGFSKKFESTSVTGSLNTSESAGGAGKMTRTTSLNLSLQHELSARTTFNLNGSVSQNESGGGSEDSSSDRTYITFGPKLSWKASPWWTITGSYSYQESENTSTDEGAAESNALYLTLVYVWPKE